MRAKRSTSEHTMAAIGYWMPLDARQVALVGSVLIVVMLSYLLH